MDLPISDIIFVVNVIKNKSFTANKDAFIKSVMNILNYALSKFMKPSPGPLPPVPAPMAMSDDMMLAELEAMASQDASITAAPASISPTMIIWLVQIVLSIL